MSTENNYIAIQTEDFQVQGLHDWLSLDNTRDGAIVTFVGLVRDFNQGNRVKGLYLEHYPAMAQSALDSIIEQARTRWSLGRICVVHRVGELLLNDNIVFVGVSAQHRKTAFEACQFVMDYLKSQVPIWKKEQGEKKQYWVKPNENEALEFAKWQDQNTPFK